MDFYCRDDNSRLALGKNETITRNKLKEQKRFPNFSIEFLYEKFKAENHESLDHIRTMDHWTMLKDHILQQQTLLRSSARNQ